MKRKIHWVCHECGMKYGRWYQGRVYSGPPKHRATYHMGKCEVCDLINVPVTEPRDYGQLVTSKMPRIE
jgi:hypothetical protein